MKWKIMLSESKCSIYIYIWMMRENRYIMLMHMHIREERGTNETWEWKALMSTRYIFASEDWVNTMHALSSIHTHTYIYIYIYWQRDREIVLSLLQLWPKPTSHQLINKLNISKYQDQVKFNTTYLCSCSPLFWIC